MRFALFPVCARAVVLTALLDGGAAAAANPRAPADAIHQGVASCASVISGRT